MAHGGEPCSVDRLDRRPTHADPTATRVVSPTIVRGCCMLPVGASEALAPPGHSTRNPFISGILPVAGPMGAWHIGGVAPYCISCGAPPLMRYRGRRAAGGPLCASCIRQQILTDARLSRGASGVDDSLRPDGAGLASFDRGGVVIDLRFTTPALAFAPAIERDELCSGVQVIDLDEEQAHGADHGESLVNGAEVNGSSVNGSARNGTGGNGDHSVAPRPRRTRPLRAAT